MNAQAKLVRYSLAAMMVLVCTGLAAAQPSDPDSQKRERKHRPQIEEVIKELNLTPEQQQQITQQRAKEKEQSEQLRQKIQDIRAQITQELDKPATDKAKVKALVTQMSGLIAQRVEQRIMGIVALKEILTPEQFKMLNEKTKGHGRRKGGQK
ncbi:MAG TPA: periplasmic heavy metal sensor [Candidatus Omnitrophota bacterium]|nr:periplasmic heavy metal sensor [Candidatus Omnitrophota bacterium]HRZ14738.1 periplasmic heavy metal sensor [Candidatus Omnitrophota bacterium]